MVKSELDTFVFQVGGCQDWLACLVAPCHDRPAEWNPAVSS